MLSIFLCEAIGFVGIILARARKAKAPGQRQLSRPFDMRVFDVRVSENSRDSAAFDLDSAVSNSDSAASNSDSAASNSDSAASNSDLAAFDSDFRFYSI
jgi:hypothetical protein